VLVVDDVEGFLAIGDGGATRAALVNASFEARLTQVGYELRRIAEQGACVIATVLTEHLSPLSPAATAVLNLQPHPLPVAEQTERLQALGARELSLIVSKNRLGNTGEVPLLFVPGAGTVEERRR